MEEYVALFDSKVVEGKQGIALLKALETYANELVSTHPSFEAAREVLGKTEKDKQKVVKAMTLQAFEGVEDFSEEFYKLLQAGSLRQRVFASLVEIALRKGDSGYSKFDTALIVHACRISVAYNDFYRDWLQAVQGNDVSARLIADIEKGVELNKELLNPYTIIQIDEKGEYFDVANATYFKKSLPQVIQAFDAAIAELSQIPLSAPYEETYLKYMTHYRACLAETDKSKLDAMNVELDMIWMDLRCPIQIVHDIETGYGDPLRCKALPDFSLRFVDTTYENENKIIGEVQKIMLSYFAKRDTPLSKKGLFALENSFAAIYYVPLQSGCSLHFRFAGQSIPNRPEVKDAKGVKIFFDALQTESRSKYAATLSDKVCINADALNKNLSHLDSITYLIAAHEVGHAIYGLSHIEDLSSPTKALLEEPRAELTAIHTLKLLVEAKYITETDAQRLLLNFAIGDLRRFANPHASAIRPYVISAFHFYKVYEELGYVKAAGPGKIIFDLSKTMDVIQNSSQVFEKILDDEDAGNANSIEATLKSFEVKTDLCQELILALEIKEE